MSVLLDIVISTVFVGILIVTIMTINTNMVMGNAKSIESYEVQTQAVQLGRIVEYDFYKIGYKAPSPSILSADSGSIRFRANLEDSPLGTVNTVSYSLGDKIATSTNPRDRQLSRVVDGATLFISYNATRFRLIYYDAAYNELPTPVSAANLSRIRHIRMILALESPDPVDFVTRTTGKRDSIYTGAYYEKFMSARNMK